MRLQVNETGEVRRETMNGREYLVAPITLIKAMDLHRGYVPKAEVQRAAPAWNGIPVTLNHPRNASGDLISANSPDVAEKVWLGHIFNNEMDGEDKTKGEAWIDIANAREKGGQAEFIIDELEDGKSLSVSSAYRGTQLPPGEYDGRPRDKVMGNLLPDHVAILPTKEGRCAIEDGCAVGMAANEVGPAFLADDSGEKPDEAQAGDGIKIDDEDTMKLGQMMLNAIGLGKAQTDDDSAETGEQTQMSDKTQELVENYGFNAANLPDEDTQCFKAIYERFTANEEDDSDGTEPEEETEAVETEEEEETIELTSEELDEKIKTTVAETVGTAVSEALAANEEQKQKSELVDEIVANSDDYEDDDREDLMDSPVKVLRGLAANVSKPTGRADYSALRGASAKKPSKASKMPALSANARIKQKESEN